MQYEDKGYFSVSILTAEEKVLLAGESNLFMKIQRWYVRRELLITKVLTKDVKPEREQKKC